MRTNTRVGALIVRNGKLLLIHRRKAGEEYWVLIGGGMEEGETREEALLREVKEETSLSLKSYIQVMEADSGPAHQVLYECEVGEGEPCLGGPEERDKSEDNWFGLEWVDIDKVAELEDLYPDIIKEWLIHKRTKRD